MGKYDSYNPQSYQAASSEGVHPVWRGIGCVLMILIPIMAFAGAVLLVQANLEQKWLPTPYELAQPVLLPYFGRVNYLYSYLLVAVILSLIGFALLSVVYALVYNLIGPSQYGPVDSLPVRHQKRRR
ncbi:MAG: hypothetical protein KAS38_13055 [Anaerolineales bacterium]|nr:hypothetical protein [Anaerolineales bacterium]